MKEITIKLTENAHPHAEMMIAKAADANLVMYVNASSGWVKTNSPIWDEDFEYFLCLPKYEKECLHWLNGGEVQLQDFPTSEFTDYLDEHSKWSLETWWMSEQCNIRIKPRKEKKWVCINKDGRVVDYISESMKYLEDSYSSLDGWQYIKVEVETNQ